MRKHPVLFGIVLLCLIGFVFFVMAFGFGIFAKDHRAFALEKVGVVTVDGVISDAQDTVDQLEEFGADDRIRAVVLRVDSPGGGVAPAQEIYGAIIELKKKKKVIVSMGSLAASGGYLIACAGDRIVANPGTLTGSISAVMHFANAEELMKKVGLKASVIKSGKYKDIGSPARAMTPEEAALLQALVDDISDQFVEVVARDRKIAVEEVRRIADGRIFTGRQALQLKLVDVLGGLKTAVGLAGRMAGIEGEPDVVYAEKPQWSLWDLLLRDVASSLASSLAPRQTGASGLSYLWQP